MVEKAYQNDIGYLPWVWKWTDCHAIVNNETGSYGSWVNTGWGEEVAVKNEYSIQNTAKRPSDLQTGQHELNRKPSMLTARPNPFTGEIFFNFRLEAPSRLRIMIRDIFGREIKILADGNYEPGELSLSWSSGEADIPVQPGIYFYTLNIENEAGCKVETGRMIKL
jgi:hypothetical protein